MLGACSGGAAVKRAVDALGWLGVAALVVLAIVCAVLAYLGGIQ